MIHPHIVVLGEIRAPRLGVLTVVHNTVADAWQVQLRRDDGKEGALLTVAIVDNKIVLREHATFEEQRSDGYIITP